MFDQILGGVQFHPYEMIEREEEEELFQARKSLTLLTSKCKMTSNDSPQEPLTEWMRNIDVLFNTIMVLKQFSTMTIIFLTG